MCQSPLAANPHRRPDFQAAHSFQQSIGPSFPPRPSLTIPVLNPRPRSLQWASYLRPHRTGSLLSGRELNPCVNDAPLLYRDGIYGVKSPTWQPAAIVGQVVGMSNQGDIISVGQMEKPAEVITQISVENVVRALHR